MKITLADWVFDVDTAATAAYTLNCSTDHCTCAYCRNFYETMDMAHPTLRPFLERFGILAEGPSEVMPLEPTLVMAAYRVTGRILARGKHECMQTMYLCISKNPMMVHFYCG